MAKINYLEVVEMLGEPLENAMKKKIAHIIGRKKDLKAEDAELDLTLDLCLRAIKGEAAEEEDNE